MLVGCAKPPPPDISIHKAVSEENVGAIKQHLAAGTDVNAKNGIGRTSLHNAAWLNHKEIAELLIANDADVNAKTGIGQTPLHFAAGYSHKNNHKEIIELLIAEGADVNAKVERGLFEGDTPLDKTGGETADLLRRHGGKTKKELEAEAKK